MRWLDYLHHGQILGCLISEVEANSDVRRVRNRSSRLAFLSSLQWCPLDFSVGHALYTSIVA